MGYKEILSTIVSNSGLTLRELADRCRDKGVSIDPSYISKLQTGKQAPGSEEVSRAIAEVCGADPDILIWEGYLEKAPELVKNTIDSIYTKLKNIISSKVSTLPDDQEDWFIKKVNALSPFELFSLLSSRNQGKLSLSSENFILALNISDDIIEKLLNLKMEDDSMEPFISKGSRLRISAESETKNGDIVAVYYGDTIIIGRITFVGEQIVLTPYNTSYTPSVISCKEHLIIFKIDLIVTSKKL